MNTYFYKPDNFFYTSLLEANWELIKIELENVLQLPDTEIGKWSWNAAHPHYVTSRSSGIAWKTYTFVFFGIKNKPNCERCPNTYQILQEIPQLVGAEFSVMEPYTHIQPHKGYSRMVLRNHLGLIVPEPEKCGLRVETEIHHWQQGKIMIFDDSFEHEAWNKSGQRRAVLMFDVANKDWGYTAEQICRYKLQNTQDHFLLQIADNATWLNWYEQGCFPI